MAKLLDFAHITGVLVHPIRELLLTTESLKVIKKLEDALKVKEEETKKMKMKNVVYASRC